MIASDLWLWGRFQGIHRDLFIDIQSCIYQAGTTSTTFSPGRGIRQGCPVSPYIFLLVVELLACLIRQDEGIQVISLGPSELRLTQFADDMTCFLSTKESLPNLVATFNLFASWSGLMINTHKTNIIRPSYSREGRTHILDIPIGEKTKILGIWIGLENSASNCYEWNFKKQLERIQAITESWHHRNLSLKGKVTVANSLLISILQYPTSVIYTPDRVTQEYKKIASHFLWDGKKPKIAHTSLIQTVENVGVKLLDLNIRTQVNLLQWARRMVTQPDMNAANALCYLLKTKNLKQYRSYRNLQPLIPPGTHKFYREMLKVSQRYRKFIPENESTIRKEALWYNNRIGPSTKGILWPGWQEQEIETVGDIYHETEDRLMSHSVISEKFSVRCTFLEALSIRASIPMQWKRSLTKN